MRSSTKARTPFRATLRLVAVAALLTQTAGGCFNTDKTCADLGKVPTCNVGAQAGTAGAAGASGAAGAGGAGGAGGQPTGNAGEAGAS
jgi:hypothetical protein